MSYVRAWHGKVFSRGDQSYGHLFAVAQADVFAVASHLSADHSVEPSRDAVGPWCRDVEAHAAAHGVVMHAKGASQSSGDAA